MSGYVPREAIARMFDAAPRDWWRFVPCSTCNASRQERCSGPEFPRRIPHIARYRLGIAIHGTLWLLREHPEDVLGPESGASPALSAEQGPSEGESHTDVVSAEFDRSNGGCAGCPMPDAQPRPTCCHDQGASE